VRRGPNAEGGLIRSEDVFIEERGGSVDAMRPVSYIPMVIEQSGRGERTYDI